MSELINNRQVLEAEHERRREKLKSLILSLHDGEDFEEIKKEFEKEFGTISAREISLLEQEIIAEGMPAKEVQRLCDVHAAVFKGSIEEIHGISGPSGTPGHPIHTFIQENNALRSFLSVKFQFNVDQFKATPTKDRREKLLKNVEILATIDRHYSRKENLLFPFLEKHGVYGPAQVMWGVDDEIRDLLRDIIQDLKDEAVGPEVIVPKIEEAVHQIEEMFFKEETILFPTAEDLLTQDEWVQIMNESDEIGYTLIEQPPVWKPKKVIENAEALLESDETIIDGTIKFETGLLTPQEIEAMLNSMPVDMTFIDKDDVVKYFSNGKERIFTRTKAAIGRTVQNCHPPKSIDIVNKILDDFKSGEKDHEDFWIQSRGQFILIRYFAVRDEQGNYLGCLEFTQNITNIKNLSGEKRLLDEEESK